MPHARTAIYPCTGVNTQERGAGGGGWEEEKEKERGQKEKKEWRKRGRTERGGQREG